MTESGIQQGKAEGHREPHDTAAFSESHADLLDLFGRWEALADSDADPRAAGALTPSCSGAARPR